MRLITNLLILALLVVAITFGFPLVRAYTNLFTASIFDINYQVSSSNSPNYYPNSHTRLLTPPNSEFWLAIPALGVISVVSDPIDIENTPQHTMVLSGNSLVHLAGTANPNQLGTTTLLAHSLSSLNWPKYNPPYFFSKRLKMGDAIVVGYKKERYTYTVKSVSTIESYPDLSPDYSSKNLLLIASQPFISGAKIAVSAELR
jgi:hypothetical protein